MIGDVVGQGQYSHVPPDRLARNHHTLLAKVDRAKATGAHVWITAMAYALSEDAARNMVAGTGGSQLLDTENLLSANQGCYVCEEPLNAGTLARRCRGEATP